ncbi:MAG: cysteine-rich KTR domain-containing protein [Candidatus Borkfalkiaceae bacterium]|nr:cysteine-rich KTR domain-containing protein [Christensenellaceae bacterium]
MATDKKWIICPRCKGKTRVRVNDGTVLINFPLFCPKCRYECVISFKNGITEEVGRDAKTQR